ncbi:hypothetical protein GUJ93_ZPchr0005g15680 [Zizania palustris]|uniref:Uncharacterized protein n=1 Tax=Zizania palustris TaxID=103762 RepID=A0A8J5SGC5_ZIZPA|nr:hypothetical protein GUJ93_ZPchr0005g15680 [Zizania palustris]
MADANKRINLAAPLRSVRRHGGGAGADCTGVQSGTGRPDAAPAGGVPFGGEHRPGHPKSVRTRRTRPAMARNEPEREEKAVVAVAAPVREEARFSDALSLADSCLTVNCSSVTALSDVGARRVVETAGARGDGGVMMDRFLPAAHAVAVCSPQCTSRKTIAAAATGADWRHSHGDVGFPRLLPPTHSATSHALCIIPNEKSDDVGGAKDDEEWDAHSTRGFSSKRCGLLPTRCMKTTLLLLNPAPAMRRRSGSWRREHGMPLLPRSGGGQNATNPLVRSNRNGHLLGHDTSMMKSWEEVYVNSLLRSGGVGRKGLGTMAAPELGRTTVRELCMDQEDRGVCHKASQLGFLLVLDRSDEECHRDYHCSPAQSFLVSGEPKLLHATATNGEKKPRREAGGGYGWPLLLEDKTTAARRDVVVPLLPPLPLPSPSESWLSRALPSVSSKPPATSFLGLHVQQRKQALPPWFSGGTPAKVVDHHRARPRTIRIHDLHKA